MGWIYLIRLVYGSRRSPKNTTNFEVFQETSTAAITSRWIFRSLYLLRWMQISLSSSMSIFCCYLKLYSLGWVFVFQKMMVMTSSVHVQLFLICFLKGILYARRCKHETFNQTQITSWKHFWRSQLLPSRWSPEKRWCWIQDRGQKVLQGRRWSPLAQSECFSPALWTLNDGSTRGDTTDVFLTHDCVFAKEDVDNSNIFLPGVVVIIL